MGQKGMLAMKPGKTQTLKRQVKEKKPAKS
jgi:hypothetical protein